MTSYITLRHDGVNNGDYVRVFATSVAVTLNKNNAKRPNANYGSGIVDVQSVSYDNPFYNINNVKFYSGSFSRPSFVPGSGNINNLDYELFKEFFKLANDDNPIILNVWYGYGDLLSSFDSSSTDIPVTFNETNDLIIDTNESREGYLPNGRISLVETKGV